MVPNSFEVNLALEPLEEAAWAEMARAESALRRHIRETCGLSARALAGLAMP